MSWDAALCAWWWNGNTLLKGRLIKRHIISILFSVRSFRFCQLHQTLQKIVLFHVMYVLHCTNVKGFFPHFRCLLCSTHFAVTSNDKSKLGLSTWLCYCICSWHFQQFITFLSEKMRNAKRVTCISVGEVESVCALVLLNFQSMKCGVTSIFKQFYSRPEWHFHSDFINTHTHLRHSHTPILSPPKCPKQFDLCNLQWAFYKAKLLPPSKCEHFFGFTSPALQFSLPFHFNCNQISLMIEASLNLG